MLKPSALRTLKLSSPRALHACAARANKAERREGGERRSREPDEGPSHASLLTRSLRDHPLPVTRSAPARFAQEKDGEREIKTPAHEANKFDLTPPPLLPRSRRIAQNEGWQWLAKEMARIAGHPPHCRKPACRRSKKCEGGRGACYLREFDTVDVTMQRFLQQNGRTLRETARAVEESEKEESA